MNNSGSKELISLFVLFIYLWCVLTLSYSATYYLTKLFAVFLGGISFFLAFLFLYIAKRLPCFTLKALTHRGIKKIFPIIFGVFLITFAFLMLYFITKTPGSLLDSGDTLGQYEQAIGVSSYNNWHPVLHTLLFFTLPLFFINNIYFVIFLQLLYFCLAFTYLIFVLYQSGAHKLFLLCLCLFVWLNPYLAGWITYPVKDIALMIFAIILIAYYIRIVCSKGSWLQRWRNLIPFALVTVACTLMRHNAILFTAPIIFLVLFYVLKNKRARLTVIAALLICFSLVKIIYVCLDVETPNLRTEEKIGLPVSIWCNVMHTNPDVLPAETREFLYDLIPEDLYAQYDINEGFNSIKFKDGVDLYKIDDISYLDVLKYTFQCFRYAPLESLAVFAHLTGLVWSIDISSEFIPLTINDYSNALEIDGAAFSATSIFVSQVRILFSSGLWATLFGSFGFEMLLTLIIGISLWLKNRLSFLHLLPLFCYNFGTALFLSGMEYRYFMLNYPLWLPVIFLMLKDNEKFKCESPTLQAPDNIHKNFQI